MNTKPFKGTNVYMSRNLVPPELFDALHDALKLNGAAVFLCCDPSRNSPNDFHVISSDLHEKFDDLRAKGCNLLGPQCILSCAKERRALPKLGYVCCLAMDGVKVLASGFGVGERERIGKLVTAMSGSFESKSSSDVSFVIVKSVLAGKYKWAASKNKHVVTINWLNQCWIEHRVVPLESYRVPPFLGLTICVTRIPADERKEMEKLIIQNGGKYSAELTKLFSEGDKFKVAQKWGTICIVTRKWFDQSLARRVCLNEEAYQVQSGSVSSGSAYRGKPMVKSGQDRNLRNSQPISSSAVSDSSLHAVPSVGNKESDVDVTLSQNISYISSYDVSTVFKKEEAGAPELPQNNKELEGCVADDSETDDLYLSDCKIYFVGFDTSDTRKLLGMVRRGGGSRYMFCNERLTHIIVGAPSDVEKRELRGLAALGVIRIVKRNWLEDCDREKKEVPVVQKHIAYDILLPKDALLMSYKASDSGLSSSMQVECLSNVSNPQNGFTSGDQNAGTKMSLKEIREDTVDNSKNVSVSVEETRRFSQSQTLSAANSKHASSQMIQLSDNPQHGNLSIVFAGKSFRFSHSFPKDKSDQVVQWINEGGGEVLDAHLSMDVDFIVECHGVIPSPSSSSQSCYVSSHWIMSCLKEGRLIDVQSHILYSPLPCRLPLPGFESLRFCTSQYSEKERSLLRNLCNVLGAKFADNLTKKCTHLLCKFANGPKYEGACKWGVHPVRCEWLYECVRKNQVVALDMFYPDEVPQNPESGLCTVTQNSTQASRLISTNNSSQVSGKSQDPRKANAKCLRKRLRPLELNSKSNQLKNDSNVEESRKNVKAAARLISTNNSSQVSGESQDLSKANAKCSRKRLKPLELISESNQLKNDSNADESHKNVNSAARVISTNNSSQVSGESQDLKKANAECSRKRLRLLELNSELNQLKNDSNVDESHKTAKEDSHLDVASAIEDLLEQTSKIQDHLKSAVGKSCEKTIFSDDCPVISRDHTGSHSSLGPSTNWLQSPEKGKEELQSAPKDRKRGIHDVFSETQTESQLVGYEEDLSGRQMIIDRVRSSMT